VLPVEGVEDSPIGRLPPACHQGKRHRHYTAKIPALTQLC
jgi:hypothetical protein